MKTLLCLLAVSLGLLASGEARSALVGQSDFSASDPVLDFETGSTAPPFVPGLGIPYSLETATFLYTPHPLFGSQVLANESGGGLRDGYIEITFEEPRQAVGAYIWSFDGLSDVGGVTMLAFDAGDHLLDSVFVPLQNGEYQFVGLGFAAPQIARVEWRHQQPAFFAIDNMVYGALAEPSSGLTALALVALAGLLALRQRSVPTAV